MYAYNSHNLIIIVSLSAPLYLSLSFSLLLQGYLSFFSTHTHYNSLLNSILITVLSSESIMSAYREVFAPIPAASFPFLGNPSYSFACTKAKAKFISTFTLFSFFSSFSFLLFSRFITTAVNSRRSQCNARKHVGWRNIPLVVVSHFFFLGPALPSLSHTTLSLIASFLLTRAREHRVYTPKGLNIVTSTITIDNSLKSNAMPINFLKSTRHRSMLRKVEPTNYTVDYAYTCNNS